MEAHTQMLMLGVRGPQVHSGLSLSGQPFFTLSFFLATVEVSPRWGRREEGKEGEEEETSMLHLACAPAPGPQTHFLTIFKGTAL